MKKKDKLHDDFLNRLCEAAGRQLGMTRIEHGFRRALAKALSCGDSTVQRWFGGSYPEASYLIRIYEKFGISPNELLDIPSTKTLDVKPLDLHKIQFIAGAKDLNIPEHFLNNKEYSVGPILKDSSSVCHPDRIRDDDIENWGICRKDLVLNRDNIYAFIAPERLARSMWPIIKPLDLIVIDVADKTIVDGGIFAIMYPNSFCTVRQVKKVQNNLILIPWFLREYSVDMINLDEHPDCIIGRVIFCITYLTAVGVESDSSNSNKSHLITNDKVS